jgi:hypothetical protein
MGMFSGYREDVWNVLDLAAAYGFVPFMQKMLPHIAVRPETLAAAFLI